MSLHDEHEALEVFNETPGAAMVWSGVRLSGIVSIEIKDSMTEAEAMATATLAIADYFARREQGRVIDYHN